MQFTFGPSLQPSETVFRIWGPAVRSAELILESSDAQTAIPMKRNQDGFHTCAVKQARADQLYRFKLDGTGPFPDPASRYQPGGVHGPSQLIDTASFQWSDQEWLNKSHSYRSIYEIHTGTFSRRGTFAGILEKLSYLKELGVDAIELMPLADFPGERNWGYEGVNLFAPARAYGTPKDLQTLVDAAHEHDLGVILDVVYNHFGPDGNYIGTYAPAFFSKTHKTNWGAAINLDGDGARYVRDFFIENAVYWITEFHFDGLRLDATHALIDESPAPFLSELCSKVRAAAKRAVFISAEDHRNLSAMLKPGSEGGWDFDGVWADDFHHHARRKSVGDDEGYYADFSGKTADIVRTINRGWFFEGQYSGHLEQMRGTPPDGIPLEKFIIGLQNHDQIGNRALGERLHHQIDAATYRALSALLLLSPETALLFMGQEWAASAPFQFFTDHHAELGKLITAGRREEFSKFSAFSDPRVREKIPDPQDARTFERSKLEWREINRFPHKHVLNFYRKLLEIRRSMFAGRPSKEFKASELNENAIALTLRTNGRIFVSVVQLQGSGAIDLTALGNDLPRRLLFSSEDSFYAPDPHEPELDVPRITFQRPGAVVLFNND